MLQNQNPHLNDISQLLQLKQQLINITVKDNTKIDVYLNEIYTFIYHQKQKSQQYEVKDIERCLEELRELYICEENNKLALGQLSVKLIDFIDQIKHQQISRGDKYQEQTSYLRSQNQFLRHQNHCFQEELDLFKEQLKNTQNQYQQFIKFNCQGDRDVFQVSKEQEIICELQLQLQELRNYVQNIKQQSLKDEHITVDQKLLLKNRSQRLNMSMKSRQSLLNLDQLTLKTKILQLQHQNEALKHQLQEYRQSINPQTINTQTMISESRLSNKISLNSCESFKKLINQPSVQHFKTLNNEFSSKLIDFHQQQFPSQQQQQIPFQCTSHRYMPLCISTEQIQIPQTKSSEHSQIQLKLPQNLQTKSTNTQIYNQHTTQNQQKECFCLKLKQSLSKMIFPYKYLHKKIVHNRIQKKIKLFSWQ